MKNDRFEFNFDARICTPGEREAVRCVYTRPNQEIRLYEYCKTHGIVCYLPLKKVWKVLTRRYGDKSYQYPNEVIRPMFPNYMFVMLTPEQRTPLYNTLAIVRILYDTEQNQQKLLDEIRLVHQIETIAIDEKIDFNAEIKEGKKFLIESGPWQGIYGWLKKKQKRFLWTVEIECVNSMVQATIDPSQYKMTPVEN
jgi:hypothetical protein